MRRFGLILVGAALALGAMALAVWVFGLLAVHSPFPFGMWKTHASLVLYSSEIISFVPFALILGAILWRLFSTRPVLDSFLSVVIALLPGFIVSLDDPRGAVVGVTEMPQFLIAFLFGVPSVVYVLERLRSNYRLERP